MDRSQIKLICIDEGQRPAWVPDDLWVKKFRIYTATARAFDQESRDYVFRIEELPLYDYTGIWGFPKDLFFPLELIQQEVNELINELNLTVNEEEDQDIHGREPS